MIRTRTLVGLVGVTSLAAVGAMGAPAFAGTSSHTMTFTSRQLQSQQTGNHLMQANRDLVAGKTIGFDVSSCTFDFATGIATCDVAAAMANGTFYARVTVDGENGDVSGRVTGGTGAFNGATGRVTGSPGSLPSDVTIKIVYRT